MAVEDVRIHVCTKGLWGGFDELATNNMESMPNLDLNAWSIKVVSATGARAADDPIISEFHFG